MAMEAMLESGSPTMSSPMMVTSPLPWSNPKAYNEVELVKEAKAGDRDAFNRLILAYQDAIFNLAMRILGSEDAADDITQITFLTAYAQLPRFRNGSFRAWVYRIATNACYDEFRLHKRHPVLSIDGKDQFDERMVPLYEFPSSSVSPEVQAERDEQAQLIQAALEQLDADQRMVVVLVDLQEFDYQQAAQALNIPIGTVKSRLSRGREHLHAILKNYDENGLGVVNH